MLTLNDSIEGIRKWISNKGRISRKTYWLYYLLPAFIFLLINSIIKYAGLLALWLLIVGTVKRFHDFNGGKGLLSGIVGFWGVALVIAVLAAIVPFLGAISGSGNSGMMNTAGMIIAIPMLAILLLPLFAGIKAGSPNENKYGPPPEPLTRASVMSVMALLAVLVIGLGAVQIARDFALREPGLIVAVDARDMAAARELLERGESPNQTNQRSTLVLAVALGYPVDHAMAALLLEHGADPNVTTDFGSDSLLQEAVRTQDLEAVQMLLEHGADPNHPNNPDVLWLAVRVGSVDIAKALLAKGANPQHRVDGRTPREWLEAYADDSGVRVTYDEMIALFE